MKYTILIVDDDETTHEVLGEYLTLSGYHVLNACNGLEGLARLRQELPDLVLLDVQMPELDGFQMLEQARRERQLAEIPVLMLTSLDRYNLKVKGLEMGADDYIVKPFNRAEILARIKLSLRRSQRYNRNSAAMSGDLTAISLSELLQTMEMGRRTATIMLPEMDARIYMETGAVVRLEQGRFVGKAAMQRILFRERGRFEVSLDDLPVDLEKVAVGVSNLLLDGLTCLDELYRSLGALQLESMVEEVSGDVVDLSHELDQLLPLSIRDFLTLLAGDLQENGEALVRAIDAGTIGLRTATI